MAQSDAFYIELRDEATSVLLELGTSYLCRSHVVYDPFNPATEEGDNRDVYGIAADQDLSKAFVSGVGQTAEASANWTAKKTLILTADAAPLPQEEVYVDGIWHSFEKVQAIKPADIVVIYMLDITR